ncbi:MAG: Nif3-like dinuclear metal center hexameric protein, partial [Rikenellaceae bacterium]|nr:Nif3-like dinuclear metal center hexameric protein [Rikenellaceae bacterium]
MKIDDILRIIEDFAPPGYQESYDNAGLAVGDRRREATGAVLCVDVTQTVLDEAAACGANLVVSHHPVIFHPLRRLTGAT